MGAEYATAYMDFWTQPGGRHAGDRPAALADILRLPLPDPMWFEYAMSANQRGRELANLVMAHPGRPRVINRVLDVGCGFGGVLATFARLGAGVCGLEIDPVRVALSRANCRDAGCPDAVRQGDVLDEALVGALGTFDLITMIDVIEHVLDVPKALVHATSLLAPGGMLWLEIPNRHSVRFVARDGHFSLFGITLLDREDARAYHGAMFSYAYDVGDYHELWYYRDFLEQRGCVFSQAAPLNASHPRELPALIRDLDEQMTRYSADIRPRVPQQVDATLRTRLSDYRAALDRDERAMRADARAEPAFREKYLVDFWRAIATRPVRG